MSVVYFDSSVLLAFLLQQPEGESAFRVWTESRYRTSSILLQAECLVNLRRNAPRTDRSLSESWLASRTEALAQCLGEVTLKDVDGSVLEILAREADLSECRTLDALHLATALYLKSRSDGEFRVVSFDERMRQTASKLNLDVFPLL